MLVAAGAFGWQPMVAHWRGLGLVLAVISLVGVVAAGGPAEVTTRIVEL